MAAYIILHVDTEGYSFKGEVTSNSLQLRDDPTDHSRQNVRADIDFRGVPSQTFEQANLRVHLKIGAKVVRTFSWSARKVEVRRGLQGHLFTATIAALNIKSLIG